jgi:hypothetical protein
MTTHNSDNFGKVTSLIRGRLKSQKTTIGSVIA